MTNSADPFNVIAVFSCLVAAIFRNNGVARAAGNEMRLHSFPVCALWWGTGSIASNTWPVDFVWIFISNDLIQKWQTFNHGTCRIPSRKLLVECKLNRRDVPSQNFKAHFLSSPFLIPALTWQLYSVPHPGPHFSPWQVKKEDKT